MKLKRKLPEACILPISGRKGVWVIFEALDWLHANDISWSITDDGDFIIPDANEEMLFMIRFATDRRPK